MRTSSLSFLRLTFLLIVGLAASVPWARAQESLPNHLSKRVVADYAYWSKYQTPAYGAEQIPYHKLSHINHAGIMFDASGALSVPDGFIEPLLNHRAHSAGVKVMLLLGGDFTGLEGSGAVQTLVDNVAAFEKQYSYDGVDIDWEYPSGNEDRRFLVELTAKLRESNPQYVLSVDAAPWGGRGYDLQHLQLSLNYINIMMYDCAGPWTAYGQLNSPILWDWKDPAPWECQPGGSVHDTANIFLRQVPPKKLNMGTPFYGYRYENIHAEFGLCPNSAITADGACDWAVTSGNYGTDFKPLINQHGWRTYYDPVAMVPYMLRANGGNGYITYDDAFSTYFRVYYADWQRGMGGTFMWSLDADYDGQTQDLLDAMYNASVASH